jgi:sporulation protein YlmC with PRC-barrel domain
MKRSLKELSTCNIKTKDGKIGYTRDFLFDENLWVIRYLVADFGKLLTPERILIPRVFIKSPLLEDKLFISVLSQAEIDNCPRPEDHMPISRKYEEEIYKHYNFDPYWSTAFLGTAGSFYPPRPINIPSKDLNEEDLDTSLRSFKEVEGYHVHASDGNIGHIEDLIIDEDDWQIIYAIVDTSNWLPWSKKVLLAIDWMRKISYVKREVKTNLTIETIKNAPEYKPADIIDEVYEKGLHDFYSRSLVK